MKAYDPIITAAALAWWIDGLKATNLPFDGNGGGEHRTLRLPRNDAFTELFPSRRAEISSFLVDGVFYDGGAAHCATGADAQRMVFAGAGGDISADAPGKQENGEEDQSHNPIIIAHADTPPQD